MLCVERTEGIRLHLILQRETLEEVTRHQRQWVPVVGGRELDFFLGFVFALTCGMWDLFCVCVAVLGLCCCVGFSLVAASKGLLSSCIAWASHCSGFSCRRVQALGVLASVVQHMAQ